jgi:hypothetical protein
MARALAIILPSAVVAVLLMGLAYVIGFPAMPPFFLVVVLLALANVGLIVGACVHVLVRDDLTGVQRLVWLALSIFLTPILAVGAILYFALGRERTRVLFRDVPTAT